VLLIIMVWIAVGIGACWLVAFLAWHATGRRRGLSMSEWIEALIRTEDSITADPAVAEQVMIERHVRETFRQGARVRLITDWNDLPSGTQGVIGRRIGQSFQVRWDGRSDSHWFPLDSIALDWLEPVEAQEPPANRRTG
jgi:hypothetical protein